jgi:hypothetical protein
MTDEELLLEESSPEKYISVNVQEEIILYS